MSRVLITRKVAPEAIEMVRAEHEVTLWEEDRPIPREELLRQVAEIDGLLCMLTE